MTLEKLTQLIIQISNDVESIHNYLYATKDLLSPYGSETLRSRIGQEVREIIKEELHLYFHS